MRPSDRQAGQEAGQEAGPPDRQAGQEASAGRRNLRLRVKFGDPRHRLCSRCKRVAVRGRSHCVWHLGRASGPLRPTPGRIASRTLGRLERQGLLPAGLISLPLWRELGWVATEARAPVRLRMVLAWDHRDAQPLEWGRIWRDARQVAAVPVRTGPMLCQ